MKVVELPQASPRKTGRPLSFNREAALEQAMLTFWRSGYETTSITDLTTAMRVTAPSLYTAFGDKKRLFLEAVRRYAGEPEMSAEAIGSAPTAYDAVRSLLIDAATAYTGEMTPKGCLLASATASGSTASADVQAAVASIRDWIKTHLRSRIERDIASDLLPKNTDAAALAGMIIAVAQGMSVLARDGSSRADLLAIVEQSLCAWPRRSI